MVLLNKIQCEQDRECISSMTNTIEKHLLAIKNLIKKVIDNKDVFEGRFRKLQTLLIASRGKNSKYFLCEHFSNWFIKEKQQKFQLELNEFSSNLTPANIVLILKEYYHTIEQMKSKEQILNDKIRRLEEQFIQIKAEEKSQRLKCISLAKQIKTK